jgi:DNA polymerase III sliding clamp (beta) subunit (PCNA family)
MLSFTLSKQALKDLQAVKVGLSKNGYSINNYFYCKVGANYLRVYAFNNDYYLTRLVKIDNASNNTNENEFLAVNDFFDFKSDCQYNIDIDNQTAVITSNNIKSNKQVFKDANGFPLFTNDNMDLIAVINANDLLQLLKVKNAVYKDKYENYEVFKSVLFDIKDNVFNSVATNRSQLYWSIFKGNEQNYLKDFYGIINEKAINALTKIIGKYNGDIYINSNNEYVSFAFNNDKVKLITKLIEGTFPRYEMVLLEVNHEGINSIKFNKDNMINTLQTLLNGYKEDLTPVDFILNDKLTLKTKESESILDYENKTNLQVKINGKYLLDYLKTLPVNIDNIIMYFKDNQHPLEFRADNYILVMTPILR